MDNLHITYLPHPSTTSETEAEALAAVYHFIIFECHEGIAATPNSTYRDSEEERSAR